MADTKINPPGVDPAKIRDWQQRVVAWFQDDPEPTGERAAYLLAQHTPALLTALEEAQRERDELRYERRLLGMARRVLDLAAEGGHLGYDVDYIRNQAADVAQRIVDEIGHPATDEPALGPSFREQLAAARADAERIREERDAARAQTVRMSRALRAAANRDGLVVQHACGAVRAFDRPPASGGCLQCADYIGGWAPLYRLGPAEDPTEPLGFFAAAESQTGGTE